MAKAKAKKYPGRRRARNISPRVDDFPTEAVFRVNLKTGEMRTTNQRGDELLEDEDISPEKLAEYGIQTDSTPLLAVLFYAKCNTRHGGCVWKIVSGRRVLVW